MPIDLFDRVRLFMNGYPDYLSMGKCYITGTIVKKNIDHALECYTLAIKEGDLEGYVARGKLYTENNQTDLAIQDYALGYQQGCKEAYQALKKIADIHADAALILADLYEQKRLWRQAKNVYYHVCDKESTKNYVGMAMYRLGLLFLAERKNLMNQVEIKKNINDAMMWLQTAALHGVSEALQLLSHMANDQKEAAYTLGQYYECGGSDQVVSDCDAFSFYLKAAYLDDEDAIRKIEYAASQGIHPSQFFDVIKFHYEKNRIENAREFYINHVSIYKTKIQLQAIQLPSHFWYMLGEWQEAVVENSEEISLAIYLYEQCGDHHAKALLRIGQLILQQDREDAKSAWMYLYKVTQLYSQDSLAAKTALSMMTCIAEDLSAHEQIQLADLYEKKEFVNLCVAKYWYQEAALAGSNERKITANDSVSNQNYQRPHTLFSYQVNQSSRNHLSIDQWLTV